MARILLLCPRTPYPLTGGAKLRMYHTARLIATDHTVDLLILEEGDVNEEAVATLEREFNSIHSFAFPTYRYYVNTVPGIASRRPLQTFYYRFRTVGEWLNAHEEEYDLAYAYHLRMAPYLRGRSVPKVVDFVDAYSLNYARSFEQANGIWRLLYRIETNRLERYEQLLLDEFDHAFITTEYDREHVNPDCDRANFSVFTNGVKQRLLNIGATPPDGEDAPMLVFVGKMDYFPNVQAVTSFATELFPRVREQHPEATFCVVGTSPSPKVSALDERPGVVVTGFVEDPVDYLADADLVVAPIRAGAGIQNKILEGMAVGRPVVTTPIGAEGIDAESGRHFETAPYGDAYVRAVLELLDDPAARTYMGEKARRFIESHHSWDGLADDLLAPIDAVLNSCDG